MKAKSALFKGSEDNTFVQCSNVRLVVKFLENAAISVPLLRLKEREFASAESHLGIMDGSVTRRFAPVAAKENGELKNEPKEGLFENILAASVKGADIKIAKRLCTSITETGGNAKIVRGEFHCVKSKSIPKGLNWCARIATSKFITRLGDDRALVVIAQERKEDGN